MTPGTATCQLQLEINGGRRTADVDPRMLLVEALRESFDVIGPKIGCGTGDCGACTIALNGEVVKACLTLAVAAQDAAIVTIEGLASDGQLSSLQEAFWDHNGFQCGYCLSGMLFAAQDLLDHDLHPDDGAIRDAISGNLCRCTGYEPIVNAISAAAQAARSRIDKSRGSNEGAA